MKLIDLSIAVILYNNTPDEIEKLIECVSSTSLSYKLFFINNSPEDKLRIYADKPNVEYYFNNKNVGFGHAQNIALEKSTTISKYHLILNPDVTFQQGTLENIHAFMEEQLDVALLMPKIYYPNGEIQKLCKLLPHPIDLIGRRFLGTTGILEKRNARYELHHFNYNSILDTPILSGCFLFGRTKILDEVGGFDERFFMYLEDFDLSRRVNKIGRTIFYPFASITHAYNKGSYTSPKLLKYHIVSAIKYFNKWGWFFDSERKMLNKKVLDQI